MLVFRMFCGITQSLDTHRTESVSVMDHEQTAGIVTLAVSTPAIVFKAGIAISVSVCVSVCLSVCLSALLIKVAVTWCDCVTLTPEML